MTRPRRQTLRRKLGGDGGTQALGSARHHRDLSVDCVHWFSQPAHMKWLTPVQVPSFHVQASTGAVIMIAAVLTTIAGRRSSGVRTRT